MMIIEECKVCSKNSDEVTPPPMRMERTGLMSKYWCECTRCGHKTSESYSMFGAEAKWNEENKKW